MGDLEEVRRNMTVNMTALDGHTKTVGRFGNGGRVVPVGPVQPHAFTRISEDHQASCPPTHRPRDATFPSNAPRVMIIVPRKTARRANMTTNLRNEDKHS